MFEFIITLIKYYLSNPIYIILIIICLICVLFEKKIIGWFGEHWTRKELKKLPRNNYTVINDVLIFANGSTHQIDHIVVSPYGIFSIETKQYNGFIVGKKYDKQWVRYVGKKKYYYTNPIRQNYGHVKSLAQLLNIDESMIYNVVCIPSRANLKIQHDGELVRDDTIVDKILSYENIIIDNTSKLVDVINKNNIKDRNIRKQHIRNIKNKNINENMNICPKCGGELVERQGYDKFMGCSNYPKCHYTKKFFKTTNM